MSESNWISCEEKLPNDGDVVLVSCPYVAAGKWYSVVRLAIFVKDRLIDGRQRENSWYNSTIVETIHKVKSWCHIPEGYMDVVE